MMVKQQDIILGKEKLYHIKCNVIVILYFIYDLMLFNNFVTLYIYIINYKLKYIYNI